MTAKILPFWFPPFLSFFCFGFNFCHGPECENQSTHLGSAL